MKNPFAIFAKEKADTTSNPDTNSTASSIGISSMMHHLMGNFTRYNPDDLMKRRGFGIYRKMLRDDQVKAAYLFLVSLILSRNWRFEKTEDAPQQAEIEDFFTQAIERLPGTFITSLKKILLSIAQGYSITEINYEIGDFNGSNKWFIKSLKSKPFDLQFNLLSFPAVLADLLQNPRVPLIR